MSAQKDTDMNNPQNKNSATNCCPVCGIDLPYGVTADRCPHCLLRAAMGSASQNIPAATTVTVNVPPLSPSILSALPSPGSIFGHYKIIRLLGMGGMGAAYEAEDIESGRRLALKVILQALDSAEARKRFLREGRLAASINHPHSVYVFSAEEINGMPVIAMEFMPGGTLMERVAAKGPLPVAEAVDCMLQVIAGLEAAQVVGILHRDVKPSNCFLGDDGVVKVGDYGLSASSVIKWDSAITDNGAFIGTPAFSSPEQIRGDEMTARSDIFAVGVTLYYLLTGRAPFQATNLAQLLAFILERRPARPSELRDGIPCGLEKAILRCLEKRPEARFAGYAELRKALSPYSSSAPTPGTLIMRYLAWLVDGFFFGPVYCAFLFFIFLLMKVPWSNAFSFIISFNTGIVPLSLGFTVEVFYFALLEGICGASLGKIICRLRVVGPNRGSPGILKSLVRVIVCMSICSLPPFLAWIFGVLPGEETVDFLKPSRINWTGSIYLLLAVRPLMWLVLFCPARRRNGFAGLHDLASGTRVVEKAALFSRPVLNQQKDRPAVPLLISTRLGPYQVLEILGKRDGEEILLGYDPLLLRNVWIRKLSMETPPVSPTICNLTRAGRLHWLAGRRSENEAWDAYEAPSGNAFLEAIRTRQDWGRVRFWLLDLAEELRAASQDGSAPAEVEFDRIWITSDGCAKILDFPVPGASSSGDVSATSILEASMEEKHARFLQRVAVAALQGNRMTSLEASEAAITVPLPLHAREFLDGLRNTNSLDTVACRLRALMGKMVNVSRLQRLALFVGTAVWPVASTMMFMMLLIWLPTPLRNRVNLQELAYWTEELYLCKRQGTVEKSGRTNVEVALEVYVAVRAVQIRNTLPPSSWEELGEPEWSGWLHLAKQVLAKHPTVSEAELTNATTILRDYYGMPPEERFFHVPLKTGSIYLSWDNMCLLSMVITFLLIFFFVLPALLCSLLFRGGSLLYGLGLRVVDGKGLWASGMRIFCRTLMALLPWLLLPWIEFGLLPIIGVGWTLYFISAVVAVLTFVVALLPDRSLADRLAGTWLVPK